NTKRQPHIATRIVNRTRLTVTRVAICNAGLLQRQASLVAIAPKRPRSRGATVPQRGTTRAARGHIMRVFITSLLLLGACATDPTDDAASDPGGKADGAGSSIRVIQAGMFRDDLPGPIGFSPKLVHYGFATERGPDWKDVHDVQVTYSNHLNK